MPPDSRRFAIALLFLLGSLIANGVAAPNAWAGAATHADTPVITWASPQPISYGTRLDATQLNATANVPGTFTYSPAAGTLLGIGTGQVLSVTFTPSDTETFTTATAAVVIDVTATPTAGFITTVAGLRSCSLLDPSDGKQATATCLGDVDSVAVDSIGDLYFNDGNHKIRKVSAATGVITTVAGTGAWGYSGDGGDATKARLFYPSGVALDPSGNVYIADSSNYRVRKVVLATGIITTVAGTGTYGDAGDGGLATAAQLKGPSALAFDSAGNLLIVDRGSDRIRKVTMATGVISTVAGTGSPGFAGDGGPATSAMLSDPRSVAFDSAWNMYISDSQNFRIRKVDAATGVISTLAGTGLQTDGGDGGLAASATFVRLAGITVDPDDLLYIADYDAKRVRVISLATGAIWTAAGNGISGTSGDGGAATSASFHGPVGVTLDRLGNIYIADQWDGLVRKVVPAAPAVPPTITVSPASQSVAIGSTATFTATAEGNPAPSIQWQQSGSPTGWVWADIPGATSTSYSFQTAGADDSLRVRAVFKNIGRTATTDPATLTVIKRSPGITWNPPAAIPYGTPLSAAQYNATAIVAGTFWYSPMVGTILPPGAGQTLRSVFTPTDSVNYATVETIVTIDVIMSSTARIITTVAGTVSNYGGGFGGDGGPATLAQLSGPVGVARDRNGNLYIADSINHRIRRVSSSGTIDTVAGIGTAGFSGDGGPATAAQLNQPWGVAVDASGMLYIVDQLNYRIRRVDAAGTITTVAGTGEEGSSGDGGPATSARLNYPSGIAVDSAGNVLIADSNNHRIRRLDIATGLIKTVAGRSGGFSGDGGPAVNASLKFPSAVAVDAASNIYIADLSNNRIRRVSAATGTITTVAGNGTTGFGGDGGLAVNASLWGPQSLGVDAAGNVYIDNPVSYRVRLVTAATGVISTVAGNGRYGHSGDLGPATDAMLKAPYGIAVDATGEFYFADFTNAVIRKVTSAGAPVVTVFPDPQSALPGSTATFIAAASGTPEPVAQWQVSLDGGATWTDIAGATETTLSIVVSWADQGKQFRVVFSNGSGAATTLGVALTVAASASAPAVTVHPLDRTAKTGDSIILASAATGVPTPTAHWEVSRNGGSTWTDVPGATHAIHAFTAASTDTNSRFRVVYTNASGSATSNTAALTIYGPFTVSATSLQFGATKAGASGDLISVTPAQAVTVTMAGTPSLWWARADYLSTWLQITEGSGSSSGQFTVSIVNPFNTIANEQIKVGTIVVTALDSPTAPITISVILRVDQTGGSASAAPFGAFDTPGDGTTGMQGSFAVTGWALDDIGIDRVELWRDLAADEPAEHAYTTDPAHPAFGKVFIANPMFVSGSRPDVEAFYPTTPWSYRAGWGYLLLSWGLYGQPTATGPPGYRLYAYAFDKDGHDTLLGTKTITVDNAHATKPFGALDTPGYGATVTGPFWNYGWALTPNATPACTIVNGSVTTHIDSGPGFVVNYGDARPDIAASFSGFSNGSNSGGAYYIDPTTLSNGMHTIGWLVYDSCGRGDGIGSRFFTVLNGGARPAEAAGDVPPDQRAGAAGADRRAGDAPSLAARPSREPDAGTTIPQQAARPAASSGVVSVRQLGAKWQDVPEDADGGRLIEVMQGGRIEVQLPPAAGAGYAGHHAVNAERRPLPVGSSLDASAGVFYWQPAPAFLGAFDLVFQTAGGEAVRLRVVVK